MRGIVTAICAALVLTVPFVSEARGLHQGPPPPGQGRGPGGPGGPRRGGFDDKILESLHLTSKQKAKIKVLKDKRRAAMMKMMGGRPGGPRPGGPPPAGGPGAGGPGRDPKMRAMMEKNRAAYQASLKKILTKGQWAKYDAAMKKMMAERRARGGAGRPPRN